MYRRNIFTVSNGKQKTPLKHSHSNNHSCDYQKLSSLSQNDWSTHSLPIFLRKKTSFAQFIANEKYNLQSFPSYKETYEITDRQKDKKKLISNFHSLPHNILKNFYSASTNVKVSGDERSTTIMTQSSDFAGNRSSNVSNAKEDILAYEAGGINNLEKKRRMPYAERPVNYISSKQTKAALCFILQLNNYINEKILLPQNQLHYHSTKFDESSEKVPESDTNTTSTVDLIGKSYINDSRLVETNDSIDISMQLYENLEITLNDNDALRTFRHVPIINNIFKRNNYPINHPFVEENDGQKTGRLTISASSNEILINTSMSGLMDTSIKPLQRSQTSVRMHILQPSAMFDSSPANSNYYISESSIALQKSGEKKSSPLFHSRCSVSLELANRDEHLVEVIELPRSSHRASRMDIYQRIHKRLVIKELIDIDLTALLRTVLQSVP